LPVTCQFPAILVLAWPLSPPTGAHPAESLVGWKDDLGEPSAYHARRHRRLEAMLRADYQSAEEGLDASSYACNIALLELQAIVRSDIAESKIVNRSDLAFHKRLGRGSEPHT
jgi:hypothetical protein